MNDAALTPPEQVTTDCMTRCLEDLAGSVQEVVETCWRQCADTTALCSQHCTGFWCEFWSHGKAMAIPTLQTIGILIIILAALGGIVFWHRSPLQPVVARFADEMAEATRRLRLYYNGTMDLSPQEVMGTLMALGLGSLGTAVVVGLTVQGVVSAALVPWK